MSDAEREHLFMLAQQRPPGVRYAARDTVSPQLQRVLDSLETSPAYVKTATWDVVAWNRAAAAVLTDYGALPPERRNILWLMFLEPAVREHLVDWATQARSVVAAFRADAVRAGASARVNALAEELSGLSAEFAAIWNDLDVRFHGEGTKRLRHGARTVIALDYSSFAVDGRPDLSLVIYTPATAADRDAVQEAVATREAGAGDRDAA